MSLPRILVIDDQLANEADVRASFCEACKVISVSADCSDADLRRMAESRAEIVAAATFCSGQTGDANRRENSVDVVDDAIQSGWPSAEGWRWALVLLDVRFDSKLKHDDDEWFGFRILEHLVDHYPEKDSAPGNCEIPVIMLSSLARNTEGRGQRAGRTGALAYVEKDLDAARLEELLEEHGLLEDTLTARRPAGRLLVGRSLALLKVLRAARSIGRVRRGSALLLGPQGSGKSTLAWYIHDCSATRAAEPVHYYVSPTTSQLQYAELFGHWQGTYTGQIESRAGRAEEAHNGTLFIDEVHGLHRDSQNELKEFGRLISESGSWRTVRRLGSFPTSPSTAVTQARNSVRGRLRDPATGVIEVDTLLLSATNYPLDDPAWRTKHGFDEALYSRLGPEYGEHQILHIPSLKDRYGDIGPLFDRFLEMASRRVGGHWPKSVDRAVYELLDAYAWEGNVAELDGVAQTAAVGARNFDRVFPRHLPKKLFCEAAPPPKSAPEIEATAESGLRDEFERLVTELEQARRDRAAALEEAITLRQQAASPPTGARLCLDSLANDLAAMPLSEDDPALQGAKPRIEAATRHLMKRVVGAALWGTRDKVTREIKRTAAVELLLDEKVGNNKSKVPRFIKEVLGQTQDSNKATDEDIEALLAAWRSGPGGKPDAT